MKLITPYFQFVDDGIMCRSCGRMMASRSLKQTDLPHADGCPNAERIAKEKADGDRWDATVISEGIGVSA